MEITRGKFYSVEHPNGLYLLYPTTIYPSDKVTFGILACIEAQNAPFHIFYNPINEPYVISVERSGSSLQEVPVKDFPLWINAEYKSKTFEKSLKGLL